MLNHLNQYNSLPEVANLFNFCTARQGSLLNLANRCQAALFHPSSLAGRTLLGGANKISYGTLETRPSFSEVKCASGSLRPKQLLQQVATPTLVEPDSKDCEWRMMENGSKTVLDVSLKIKIHLPSNVVFSPSCVFR